jgi:hypothetical protein
LLHISSIEFVDDVKPVVRDYYQECIDRVKAARARMAAAALNPKPAPPRQITVPAVKLPFARVSKVALRRQDADIRAARRADSIMADLESQNAELARRNANRERAKAIQYDVSVASGVHVSKLRARGRTPEVVLPRAFAFWLVRRLTKLSYPEIGVQLGQFHHTSVMFSCEKIQRMFDAGELPPHLLALVP